MTLGSPGLGEEAVRDWLALYIDGATSTDMQTYGRDLLEQLHRDGAPAFFFFVRRLMQLGRMWGVDVLDVGCGYGWLSAAIALLGANTVTGNDVRPGMTLAVAERTAALEAAGAPLHLTPLLGDICDLDLPERSFDTIVSSEAIEHIRDLDAFFAQCSRLLKSGGRCVLTDSSNARNRRLLSSTRRMWKERDASWAFVREQQRRKPDENVGAEPYAIMREAIISHASCGLQPADIRRLIAATAGLTTAQIQAAVAAFLVNKALPEPPALSWCRNPATGEYCERLLDPYAVGEGLARHGFDVQVLPLFRRQPLRALSLLSWRPLQLLLFNVRSQFVVVGRRNG